MSKTLMQAAFALALTASAAITSESGQAPVEEALSSPGIDAYAFPLAEPGSYELPPIKRAAGGRILDEHGRIHDLADMLRGRITILTFIYTNCGDVCPAANLQIFYLQELAAKYPKLASQIQLLSMSFDPEHDTPQVIAEHAHHWRSQKEHAPEWKFFTAPDEATLAPILTAYDQTVRRKQISEKSAGNNIYHIFRGFLIDRLLRIRNIYSLDFLEPALVLNDVKTLIAEEKRFHDVNQSNSQ